MAEIVHTTGDLAPQLKARSRRRWSAADTVIAIAGALIFIVFAIFALLCVQGYSSTIEQSRTKAQEATDIIADETEWMIGSAMATLGHVALDLDGNPPALTAAQRAGFDAMLKPLPAGGNFAVFDASGEAVPNGTSPSLPANIADQDYFKTLQGGANTTISMQVADAATGQPSFVVAQRLGGSSGFTGIAAIVINGSILADFWDRQKLGPESTVSILRDDGWVVARYPALPAPVNSSTQPVFEAQKDVTTGSYVALSPIDGITRVVAFHRLPQLGVVAIASISQDAVMAGLWTSIITVLWLMVPIALALLVGSLITASILRRSARTQASLAAAVEHNEVLFREIHHRVKNNLQSVASLLQMQPIPKEIKSNMGQRIAAMSAVHEHIYRSNDFATVRVKSYLETLIEGIRAGQDPNVKVVEQFEDLAVDKDAATPLGLIVNEVVANTFKHAFTDGRQGRIEVQLSKDEAGRGRLVVEDNGVGFDPEQPTKGIGRRLVTALTMQLGGESAFSAAPGGGSRFTLSFPLADAPAA